MSSRFGNKIRELREGNNLLLRQVASQLDMDLAQLSKIEKGSRQMKREQIPFVAKIFGVSNIELETLWLTDQLVELVKDEPTANLALEATFELLNIEKTKV